MIFLPKCAAALAALCPTEQGHYALASVRLRETAGNNWRAEATDGKVLAILQGPSAPSDRDLRLAAELPRPAALLTDALVPAPALRDAAKAGDKDGRIAVLLGSPQIQLAAGAGVVRCEPGVGRFPDCDAVLPKRHAMVSVRIDADYLIDLLRCAAAVAKTVDKDKPVVQLHFYADSLHRGDRYASPLGLTTQGAGGLVFDGLVMPLTN